MTASRNPVGPSVRLPAAHATELGELCDLLADWLETAPNDVHLDLWCRTGWPHMRGAVLHIADTLRLTSTEIRRQNEARQ